MRSAGGTKSELPSVVTCATKAMIAFFAAPSFQEGSGSEPCARAGLHSAAMIMKVRTKSRLTMELAFTSCGSSPLYGRRRNASRLRRRPLPSLWLQSFELIEPFQRILLAQQCVVDAAGVEGAAGLIGELVEVAEEL